MRKKKVNIVNILKSLGSLLIKEEKTQNCGFACLPINVLQ